MWIEKLARGVLELDTPIGPRYLEPAFIDRLRLVWTFRNFGSLPHQVLSLREQRLIDRLANENRFVSISAIGVHDLSVIGRVERRVAAPVEPFPARKPVVSVGSPVAERGSEPASA